MEREIKQHLKRFAAEHRVLSAVLVIVLLAAAAGVYFWLGSGEPAATTEAGSEAPSPVISSVTPEPAPSAEPTEAETPTETPSATPKPTATAEPEKTPTPTPVKQRSFRDEEALRQHFEKHGAEFPYATAEEYLAGANRVIQSSEALYKREAEDGDEIYYLEESNEIVFVSRYGIIRTYFRPSAGIDYFNRQ